MCILSFNVHVYLLEFSSKNTPLQKKNKKNLVLPLPLLLSYLSPLLLLLPLFALVPLLAPPVLSPTQFTIGDTTGDHYLPYQHGGIVRQLKVPKTIHFVSVLKL